LTFREQRASPAVFLAALLDRPGLCTLTRQLLGTRLERATFGLPRRVADGAEHCFRAVELVVECEPRAEGGMHGACLLMSAERAAGLVDRMLGGPGDGGGLVPSTAECGVLAYGAARLLAELAQGWVLCDVRVREPRELVQRAQGQVLWPLSVASELGPIDVRLLLSETAARSLPVAFELCAVLRDQVSEASLRELRADEVLASDAWSLVASARGWSGPMELLVAGASCLRARVEHGEVMVREQAHTAVRDDELVVVLARRWLNVLSLADVLAQREPAFGELEPREVELMWRGRTLAHGQLTRHRGEVCVRITRCDNAASPAPRHA
jgi:hypothetical protein